MISPIVTAEFVARPQNCAGLFPGRPWVVYFERAIREDGRRVLRGMRGFVTEADAAQWQLEVAAPANADDLPF